MRSIVNAYKKAGCGEKHTVYKSKGRSRLEGEQICRPSRTRKEKRVLTEPALHIPERKKTVL